MELQESVLFTDIAIVLGWIKNNEKHVKPFVASGVNEIRSNVKPPSEQNVADDISRGLSVPELSELDHTPQSSFGDQKARDDAPSIERECKTQTVGTIWNSIYRCWCVIECKSYSSWRRLVQITSWTLRYKNNLLRRARKLTTGLQEKEELEPLSPNEIQKSAEFWIKEYQKSLKDRMKRNEFFERRF